MRTLKDKTNYSFGEFILDQHARLLLRAGRRVPLTPKEFCTLLALVEARGDAVERERLILRVWPDTFVCESSLDRNISVLRKRLTAGAIETVPRFGYRLTLPVGETPRAQQSPPPRATAANLLPSSESDEAESLRAMIWGYLGMGYTRLRQYERAAHAYEQAVSLSVLNVRYDSARACALALNGERGEVQELNDASDVKATSDTWMPAAAMVFAYIGLGDSEKVRSQHGQDEGSAEPLETNTETIFAAFHDDRRFVELITQLTNSE